jgi:hypothetical protein
LLNCLIERNFPYRLISGMPRLIAIWPLERNVSKYCSKFGRRVQLHTKQWNNAFICVSCWKGEKRRQSRSQVQSHRPSAFWLKMKGGNWSVTIHVMLQWEEHSDPHQKPDFKYLQEPVTVSW